MKNNIKWYLVCLLGFIPLFVSNLLLPLHYFNLRPFNGLSYYLVVFFGGIMILGPITLTIWVSGRKIEAKIFNKIIAAIFIIYGSYGLTFRVSFLRKENHLLKYGKEIDAKVIKYELISNKMRVYFNYTSQNKEFMGALDYSRDEIDKEDTTINIIISTKDPRIYEYSDF
jgi:hypothetical protein